LVIFTAHFQGILKYRGRKRIFTMSLLISYNAFNITRIIQRPLSAVATVNEAIDSEWNITTGLFGLWMRVKLSDNFQMHEHSWPCRFHIIGPMLMDHGMPYPKKNVYC
jgi:hypothetical protein